jgi:hypothetical protein
MMDNKMIVEDSLESSDKGFAFYGRLPYYRGLGLSMVEDIAITVDGEAVPREDVRFHVRGKTYTLDQMETVFDDRWNFGEQAKIIAVLRCGCGCPTCRSCPPPRTPSRWRWPPDCRVRTDYARTYP